MIVSLLHIVWYCKFCEESWYSDLDDISAFSTSLLTYERFNELQNISDDAFSESSANQILYRKSTKIDTKAIKTQLLKNQRLDTRQWVWFQVAPCDRYQWNCLEMRVIFVLSMKNFKDWRHIRKSPQ